MYYYVYHARFQPLTKLHEEELFWLVRNISPEDKIIIGIVEYDVKKEFEGLKEMDRLKPEFNQLTYWERMKHIEYFIEKNKLQDIIPYIVPLSRPSKGMKHASNFLPPQNQRKICWSVGADDFVKDAVEEEGEEVFSIPFKDFQANLRVMSCKLICSLIVIGNDAWKDMVDEWIYSQLTDVLAIGKRIKQTLSVDKAQRILSDLYENNKCDDEKTAMRKYIDKSSELVKSTVSENIEVTVTLSAIRTSIERQYNDKITQKTEEKNENERKASTSSGFSREIYKFKATCLQIIIDHLDRLCAQDISQIPDKATVSTMGGIIEQIKIKIERVINALNQCFEKIPSIKEGDFVELEKLILCFKQELANE